VMTLRIEFVDLWPLILLIATIVAPLTWMCLSSIRKNDITRVGVAHKGTAIWIESKRSPRKLADIPSKSARPTITRTGS
jgi:hypothetical protein